MPRLTLDGFKVKNLNIKKAFYQVINIFFKNPHKVYKYYYKEMDHNIIKL